MTRSDLLFFGKDLSALVRSFQSAIQKKVAGWERIKILGSSEWDLVSYLVEQYSPNLRRLLRDRLHIESEGESNTGISGSIEYDIRNRGRAIHGADCFAPVAIPFEWDGYQFHFQASTFNFSI